MTAPDPKTVREIARTFLTDPDVSADELDYVVRSYIGYASGAEHQAWRDAVRADADDAEVVTIASWPAEQQPADVVTAEQQQDGAATEAAGRVTAFCEALDHYGDDGNPIASEQNPDGDPDTVLYLTLTKQDLRAVLAERTALAARVAELEGERTEDARAVDAVAAAEDDELLDRAISNLIARFADRIETLDATETEES